MTLSRPGFVLHRNSSRLAQAVMPRQGTAAETYVAYGMTQKLFEACSMQADYSIPQVSQRGAQVPKTAAGEDLGVGAGWWYEGVLPGKMVSQVIGLTIRGQIWASFQHFRPGHKSPFSTCTS